MSLHIHIHKKRRDAAPDPYAEGLAEAKAGRPWRNPYPATSRQGREWQKGYERGSLRRDQGEATPRLAQLHKESEEAKSRGDWVTVAKLENEIEKLEHASLDNRSRRDAGIAPSKPLSEMSLSELKAERKRVYAWAEQWDRSNEERAKGREQVREIDRQIALAGWFGTKKR